VIYCKELHRVTPENRYGHCQQHARPILNEQRTWLDAALPQVPPTSATDKAQTYLYGRDKLNRYLDDGRPAKAEIVDVIEALLPGNLDKDRISNG